MSTNSFENFTNFLKNVPPTKAVLVGESLADIATLMRHELASYFGSPNASLQTETTEEPPIALLDVPLLNDAWVSQVRATFHTHGTEIEALLHESAELQNVVNMLKFAVLAGAAPGPNTDLIVAYFERLLAYLARSTQAFTMLHSLAKTVNAVMREHEE
jgi:hypothetical protein